MPMFSKLFWIDTAERVIRTAAQSFLGGFTGAAVATVADLQAALYAGGLAAVVGGIAALAMALAAQEFGDSNSASVVLEVKEQ